MSYLESSKKFDPVFPGEQWFLYWKTSAALWESRIVQIPQHEVVFIPIYWGHHAESSTLWDFGQMRPERDLLRLTQLMTQHGRKFCWILPVTPSPFLPNGGVPVAAARTLAIDKTGVHLAVLDNESHLNKIFSYFGPKVFQSFTDFLKAFGHFLGKNKIQAPVWGAQFYYCQDGKRHSFIEDHSLAFEQGFSRFLKKNHPEGAEISDYKKELEMKGKFTQEVEQLFSTTAETALGPLWKGIQKIFVIGSGPKETILRSIPSGKSQLEYTRDVFQHYINSEWITSVLLGPSEKKETLNWILNEHFGPKETELRYNYQVPKNIQEAEFRPFGIMDIIGKNKDERFVQIGLTKYLDHHFRWLYQIQESVNFSPESIDLNHHKLKFFNGADLTRITFAQMLKLFMMGQKIILDRSAIAEELDKKLQVFLVENNIKTQKLNFQTQIQICELGEGKLIILEGDKLLDNPSRDLFWVHIFKYLNFVQLDIKMDEDVFSLWRIRSTSPHELSYLDVRRVNLYNPTSYKKTVSIKTHKHFAFMKKVDPTRATAKSTTDGVEVELLPDGKIALDFGHYEEI